LANGTTAVVVLNKDAENDLSLRLDFRDAKAAKVAAETLNAPALDSREAHITPSPVTLHLKNGKIAILVPHASGLLVRVG
jgi:hypothetical protein